jgi:hypothetical protein
MYKRWLRGSAILTRLELFGQYGQYGHMFWISYSELGKSERFVEDMRRGLRQLLGPPHSLDTPM